MYMKPIRSTYIPMYVQASGQLYRAAIAPRSSRCHQRIAMVAQQTDCMNVHTYLPTLTSRKIYHSYPSAMRRRQICNYGVLRTLGIYDSRIQTLDTWYLGMSSTITSSRVDRRGPGTLWTKHLAQTSLGINKWRQRRGTCVSSTLRKLVG